MVSDGFCFQPISSQISPVFQSLDLFFSNGGEIVRTIKVKKNISVMMLEISYLKSAEYLALDLMPIKCLVVGKALY